MLTQTALEVVDVVVWGGRVVGGWVVDGCVGEVAGSVVGTTLVLVSVGTVVDSVVEERVVEERVVEERVMDVSGNVGGCCSQGSVDSRPLATNMLMRDGPPQFWSGAPRHFMSHSEGGAATAPLPMTTPHQHSPIRMSA